MNKFNDFFRKVVSSPMHLWNGSAALIFICIGIAVISFPSVLGGDNKIRFGFGGMLLIYGLFRLWTFTQGLKSRDDA